MKVRWIRIKSETDLFLASEALEGNTVVLIADTTHAWSDSLIQRSFLFQDESQRAHRFKVSSARNEFLLGRALVRAVVSRVLERPPSEIEIAYGRFGKPYLADDGGTGLTFNLSHSAGSVVCAFRFGSCIGVDIERSKRSKRSLLGFAGQFLSAEEQRVIGAFPDPALENHLLRAWRSKEAVLKAAGCGLAKDPRTIAIIREMRNQPYCDEETCLDGQVWRILHHAFDPTNEVALAWPAHHTQEQ